MDLKNLFALFLLGLVAVQAIPTKLDETSFEIEAESENKERLKKAVYVWDQSSTLQLPVQPGQTINIQNPGPAVSLQAAVPAVETLALQASPAISIQQPAPIFNIQESLPLTQTLSIQQPQPVPVLNVQENVPLAETVSFQLPGQPIQTLSIQQPQTGQVLNIQENVPLAQTVSIQQPGQPIQTLSIQQPQTAQVMNIQESVPMAQTVSFPQLPQPVQTVIQAVPQAQVQPLNLFQVQPVQNVETVQMSGLVRPSFNIVEPAVNQVVETVAAPSPVVETIAQEVVRPAEVMSSYVNVPQFVVGQPRRIFGDRALAQNAIAGRVIV